MMICGHKIKSKLTSLLAIFSQFILFKSILSFNFISSIVLENRKNNK